MKFDFAKKIRSGYLAAFLLLLLCYFLSLSSFIQLRNQNNWVSHTQEVIKQLAILNADFKDAEINWHEYLLNKEPRYLDAYRKSRNLADSMYAVLLNSVRDNPLQKERVTTLHGIIETKYKVLDDELRIFSHNHFQMDDSLLKLEEKNKQLIDSVNQAANTIIANENLLLAQRTQRVISNSKIVFWIMISAGTVSFLLIVYSLITFNMESKAKNQANIQAASYHDQLEKRITELANANRELLELRSLERFTSTGRIARVIAHEIRNPLTNIDLSASHLDSPVLTAEDKRTFLDIIARNSRRINELINELLSATKFTDLHYEEIRVDHLLDESLNEAVDRAKLNQVQIVKKYTKEKIWLNVDKSRMKIALLNVIVNAMEAITGGQGRLELETTPLEDQCLIIIRDNGKGMDLETLAKVFDPYFTSKSKGNGLGMTNTQNIILNHKGKIEALSEPGKGTAFIITLNILRKENPPSV